MGGTTGNTVASEQLTQQSPRGHDCRIHSLKTIRIQERSVQHHLKGMTRSDLRLKVAERFR